MLRFRVLAASGPVKTAALLLALAISLPLVAGLLGRLHPAFDAFSHFRAHLAVLLAMACLLLLATRQWLHGAAGLLLAIGAFATTSSLAPFHGATPAAASDVAGPRYRLLQLNMRYDHPDPARVLSLIGRTRPDVVTLNEASPAWRQSLQAISAAYPHRLDCPDERSVGSVLILSRRPFLDMGVCGLGGRFGLVTVDFGGHAVEIASLHLLWPWPFAQPRQIRELLPTLGALSDTALLAGDLNAADWSASVRTIAAAGGFTAVPRLGPTWLVRSAPDALRRWLGLPIDHVLAKPGVLLVDARRLEGVGSDHLPVLVEFTLRPEQPPGTVAVAGLASPRRPHAARTTSAGMPERP
ncbi:endonuclease/exonuclease/phosphatase family protein [Aquibium microcysteis]|uniref:endonuclease/exonuclease/phosphatase family protein n=1 Tax=Aquibium microcysteis TaxID=675281 RepID=UPI00165CF2D5|nr:endonuclease/exonuclease/phosphatase family protein [Aquibium microcysteis]